MKKDESIIPSKYVERSIYIIRGQKVILDQDLAALYGVETKALNQAVQRNTNRFPEDFAFRLAKDEWNSLRSQFVTSNVGRGGRRYLPLVFTEHGVVMAANVLKSKRAISVSIDVVRTFIKLRETLASHKELIKELGELKEFVLKNSHQTSREFRRIWQTIEKLTNKPKNQRSIGFKLE
ncbi:ORF6N domain-containing protein [Candidatus Peregrinibacteria bacterium]|nr:ORF6N domain-containing protein [Candidatus Peregrinibacteria bacterium]